MSGEAADASGTAGPPRGGAIEIHRGRPPWRAQLGGHLAAGLVLLAGLAATFLLPMMFHVAVDVSFITAAVVVGAALLWLVSLWWKRAIEFRLTTRAIDVESGVLGRRIDTLQLWKVRDLQFEQTPLDRIMGLATIRAYTQDVSNPVLVMWGLPSDRTIFERLKSSVEEARQARNLVGIVE